MLLDLGFLKSETIRINIKDTTLYPDFSEMFVVSHSYKDRAVKYVRTDGNINFAAGSEADDVLDVDRGLRSGSSERHAWSPAASYSR